MKSWIVIFYLLTGLGTAGVYGYTMMTGWEKGTPERGFIPSEKRHEIRSSRYRGGGFWYIYAGGYRRGYRGGK